MDQNGEILYEGRRLLDVKKGTIGLRQSDAFFQHVNNLPELIEACMDNISRHSVNAIVVSSKPRNVEGSYMPVFLAGLQFARTLSVALDASLYQLSHQENHLYASGYNHILPERFLGVHISGGTTEILNVKYNQAFEIDCVGYSLDLSFGKLIDRLGVHMGLDFPCGKALDELSLQCQGGYRLKKSIKGLGFNISGIENQLKQKFDQDKDIAKVSYSLFQYLGELLTSVLNKASDEYGLSTVVLSGGVSANQMIRRIVEQGFQGEVIFTDVAYATDHAIGNAYYGTQVMK